MKNIKKAGKFVNVVLAATALATAYFGSVAASQAGWIYTSHGYVFCNYSYGYADCQ